MDTCVPWIFVSVVFNKLSIILLWLKCSLFTKGLRIAWFPVTDKGIQMLPFICHLVIRCLSAGFACPLRLNDHIFLSCPAQGDSVHGFSEFQKGFLPFAIHFRWLPCNLSFLMVKDN